MHSGRMRAVCSSSCSGWSAPGGGGDLFQGGLLQEWSGPGGLLWGVSASGGSARGVCSRGSAPGGEVCVPQHALGQIPPVNRMTDRCKNITFTNFVCGR